jgi:hypothetical protein
MCKYGDFFLKLEIAEKFGVYNVIPYTAYHIERLEGTDRTNPSKIIFRFDPDGISASSYGYANVPGVPGTTARANSIIFDNYEIAHFRLLADMNFLPYGRSYIEPARKLYKQYTLMEDAMLIHRIVRAPEKRIFYMNVGSIPPQEIDAFMEKTISKMKRTPYIDQQTGEYNLRYNLQNSLEDFYIPVRGNDQTTRIDTTKGLEYTAIDDVKYLRDKLFAALKIPRAFMGYEENLNGKATLAAQDIRFARTIERIQRIITSELYKIATIHLYTQGYTDESLTNFELSLTTPSIIYEQEKVALLKEKVDLANQMLENNLLPTDWIYENIFQLSQNQYDDYRDLAIEDAKRKFRLKQISEEGNDPIETGRSYGTPHDLASLYGKGRYDSNDVPEGYDEEKTLGRPEEKVSNRNTQNDNFGKDRLGTQAIKDKDRADSRMKVNYKGGSPLALEGNRKPYRNTTILKDIPTIKQLVFESKDDNTLLDESNVKE